MMTKPRSQTYYYNALTGAQVTPDGWQTKIKKGDHYEIVTECFPTIYGVILEPFREIGYYRVRAYSEWCLDGQEGTLCIVEPTRILTRQEFEQAQIRHWKTEEQTTETDIQ
jgi:hypothetical protein